MHCNIIPDNILKHIKDLRSLKISKKIRGLRNKAAATNDQSERVTFDTKTSTNLPGIEVARDLEVSKDADELAQLAHIGAKQVHDWLYITFGINSIDNKGLTLKSTVHYDKNYNNAFWNGQQMVYGDGDGKFFIPLVKGDDVRCHEIVHGLTQFTANLNYYSQSGALNEAFSDIFGIAFKQFLRNQADPNSANWLIGDDICGPNFPGKALRSFKNEKAYSGDTQPKHMKNYSWTLSDSQGVHTNSGIINHFFYKLCINSGSPSFQTPIQIMYKTLLRLSKYSGFKTFAKEARSTAIQFGGSWVAHVDKALKEVGL